MLVKLCLQLLQAVDPAVKQVQPVLDSAWKQGKAVTHQGRVRALQAFAVAKAKSSHYCKEAKPALDRLLAGSKVPPPLPLSPFLRQTRCLCNLKCRKTSNLRSLVGSCCSCFGANLTWEGGGGVFAVPFTFRAPGHLVQNLRFCFPPAVTHLASPET